MSEVKEMSKTEQYKVHLQKIVAQELGVKVSKDKAWNLFKAVINGTVQFVLKLDDQKMPLAGVGTFEVLKTKPRGTKAGLDENGNAIPGAKVWEFVPRMRLYFSSVVDKQLEQFFGLEDHGIEMKDYGIFVTDDAPAEVVEEAPAKATAPAEQADPFADLL